MSYYVRKIEPVSQHTEEFCKKISGAFFLCLQDRRTSINIMLLVFHVYQEAIEVELRT